MIKKKNILVLIIIACFFIFYGCSNNKVKDEKKKSADENRICLKDDSIKSSVCIDKKNEFGFSGFKILENDTMEFYGKDNSVKYTLKVTINLYEYYSEFSNNAKSNYEFKNFKTDKYSGYIYTTEYDKNTARLTLELEKNDDMIYLLYLDLLDTNNETDKFDYNLFNDETFKKFLDNIDIKIDYKAYKDNIKIIEDSEKSDESNK